MSEQSLPELVLASGSPRRRQLLETLDIPFVVISSAISEKADPSLDPLEMVRLLAALKAKAVACELDRGLVIGADTIGVLDGEVLGKPLDGEEAGKMLRTLRNRQHQVVSGVAVVDASTQRIETGTVITYIQMRNYTDGEIEAYIATGEPMDKAASYAIQGQGGALVEAVKGCYNNVIGFPLCELTALLERFDVFPGVRGAVCKLPSGAPCPRSVDLCFQENGNLRDNSGKTLGHIL